jgi:hypothetical protein
MRSRKVKVGVTYTYVPVMMDQTRPASTAVRGQRVTVVNLPSCPPANTMGHCHVRAFGGGEFLGLVCTNSLYRNFPIRWTVHLPGDKVEQGVTENFKTYKGALRWIMRKYPEWTFAEVRHV